MDLLNSRSLLPSKKLDFTKERCPKGNLAGMVLEYVTSALHTHTCATVMHSLGHSGAPFFLHQLII